MCRLISVSQLEMNSVTLKKKKHKQFLFLSLSNSDAHEKKIQRDIYTDFNSQAIFGQFYESRISILDTIYLYINNVFATSIYLFFNTIPEPDSRLMGWLCTSLNSNHSSICLFACPAAKHVTNRRWRKHNL